MGKLHEKLAELDRQIEDLEGERIAIVNQITAVDRAKSHPVGNVIPFPFLMQQATESRLYEAASCW